LTAWESGKEKVKVQKNNDGLRPGRGKKKTPLGQKEQTKKIWGKSPRKKAGQSKPGEKGE